MLSWVVISTQVCIFPCVAISHSLVLIFILLDDALLLRLAANKLKHLEAVQALIQLGADMHTQKCLNGGTILHEETTDAIIRELVHSGADCNALDKNWHAPLHMSAARGDLPCVLALLELGAKVDARDDKDQTPLFGATATVMETLVRHGANINAVDNTGATPLLYTVTLGRSPAVQELLKLGANTNIKDAGGRDLVSIAYTGNFYETVGVLASYGVSLDFIADKVSPPSSPIPSFPFPPIIIFIWQIARAKSNQPG